MTYNPENQTGQANNQAGYGYPYPVSPSNTANPYQTSQISDALNQTESYFQNRNNLEPSQAPLPSKTVKLPSPILSTLCFFLAILLFETLGILLRKSGISSIMLTVIGEIGVIAALPIIFTGLGNFDFKAVFSVRKISFFTVFLCVVLGLAAQLAIIAPNAFGLWLLQQIGPLYLPADSGLNLNNTDKLLFSAAALFLAPLCEETLNRGFVMAGYKRFGLVRTIIVIGILFGLFHMYPYKFIGTGLGGVILAYVCYTTGSIYSSMAAHFGFNLLPTVILWISDPLRHLLPNGVLNNVQTTLAYQAKGDIETRVNGSAVTFVLLLSGLGLALTLLLLRVISVRTAKKRPGIVLNYFGLASEIDETSKFYRLGQYYGPNAAYTYGKYGFEFSEQPQTGSNSKTGAFSDTNPIGKQNIDPNSLLINAFDKENNNEASKFAQSKQLNRPGKIFLSAIWFILLVLYAYGAYQEIFLRVVGRDCEVNGFQHCENMLPKSALVVDATQEAFLPQIVNIR